MKSKKLIIVAAVILVLFLISCTSPAPETTSSPEESSGTQWGTIQPSSRVKEPAPNADIVALLQRNKDVTNYHYVFDADKVEGYEVFISGSNVKKVYIDAKPLRGDIFYNTIYLNRETKTAVGICNKPGVTCGAIWNKAYIVDYESENIGPTPVEMIDTVRNPQEVGSEVMLNRDLTIIEFINADGKKERWSLDDFYGLPSRQVIYSSDEEIEESHTFIKLSVGQVQEEEVRLPEEYIIQE